ncbi:MAG: Zn-ribbon domain-containing OB-fold protein [bacterium]
MGLTEKVHRNADLSAHPGEIPVNYLYTMGLAGEGFFRALKDRGRLTAAACPACGTVYLPPRIFCERCFERTGKPFAVASTGTVHTFTVCHEEVDGSPKGKPEIVAAVRIDGTDGTLVHRLDGVAPGDVYIGMRVKMVLKPAKKREGNILDIMHFKPV